MWYFEAQQWNNLVGNSAAEVGAGPGSYDITKIVWHLNASISPKQYEYIRLLIFLSMAAQNLMAVAAGECLDPSLAGRTLLPMALLSLTISIGSL
jgi:hypothetical protein